MYQIWETNRTNQPENGCNAISQSYFPWDDRLRFNYQWLSHTKSKWNHTFCRTTSMWWRVVGYVNAQESRSQSIYSHKIGFHIYISWKQLCQNEILESNRSQIEFSFSTGFYAVINTITMDILPCMTLREKDLNNHKWLQINADEMISLWIMRLISKYFCVKNTTNSEWI